MENKRYAYVNRLDLGKTPSNSAADLKSNMFALRTFIPYTIISQIFKV